MTTSPDLQPFVDLTLFDVDSTDLLDLALAAAATTMPDLVIREGFTEAVILEGQAAMDAEIVFRVNRLVPALMEGVMNILGLVRDPGSPAQTDVLFQAFDTAGHTVPAGTRFTIITGPDDTDATVFATDVALQIATGAINGSVSATALTIGAGPNGWVAGSFVDMLDAVSFVNASQIVTTVHGGRDPETDEQFYTRGAQAIARQTTVLVRASQFVAYALQQPYVYRALALDNTNGSGTVGAAPGHITLAILGPDGLPVSSANKAALLAQMQALCASMLQLHLIDATITSIPVDVSIHVLAGYTAGPVIAAVGAALTSFLSPLQWPWGPTVRRNELIALVSNVPGVDYVSAITNPSTDVALTGSAPLPTAGSINVSAV